MRLNRWLRGTALVLAVCFSALCLAWNVFTWRLEQDPSSTRADVSADSFVSSSDFEEPVSRARYHLRALMIDGNIPAVAVAVRRRGSLVWSEALGYGDVEARRPAHRQTRFRIQSLSKTLTASALLRLVDLGIIRLESPVQDYPNLMREHVFAPLGMTQTTEFRLDTPHPLEATAYDFVTPYSRDGTRVRSPAIDFSCKWPSGGVLSTADDMARFAAAHSVHTPVRWLTTQSTTRQFTPRTPSHSPVGVGLGWLVGRDWRLRRVVFNFGAGSGGRAFVALYPEDDVAVAVLGNLGHARMDMRRLSGIAVPFLRPSRAPAPEVALLLTGIG